MQHRCVSLLSPPKIVHRRGNFIYFSKTESSDGAAHKVGLPLRLHLHILHRGSGTNEFISYLKEPSRSTLASPPCQPQVWPRRGTQMELKQPGCSRVLRARLNFSPGPHLPCTSARSRFSLRARGRQERRPGMIHVRALGSLLCNIKLNLARLH